MKNRYRFFLKTICCLLTILFAASPAVFAQNSTTGLSGSLESSRQTHFYKEPTKAFLLGFFPGLLIHGNGHFYAKDKLTGTALLSGEVLSVISISLGAAMKSNPNSFTGGLFGGAGEVSRRGRDMMTYGGILFGLTWLADMVHAPIAAKSYNDEHDLKPVVSIQGDRPNLLLAYRF